MLEQRHELLRFPTLREQDRDVVRADDPEIAVDALHRVEERRGSARRRQRRRDLARDQPRLADAGNDDTTRGALDEHHRAPELVAEPTLDLVERVALHAQHAPAEVFGAVGEDRVGERVLPEYRCIADVHQEPQHPCRADADEARLLDAPVEQHQREEIGTIRERDAAHGNEVQQQPAEQRQQDEPRFCRPEDLLGRRRAEGAHARQHSHCTTLQASRVGPDSRRAP
jgi:hypothetical protein